MLEMHSGLISDKLVCLNLYGSGCKIQITEKHKEMEVNTESNVQSGH